MFILVDMHGGGSPHGGLDYLCVSVDREVSGLD
jgi:hypothetical protein